MMPKVIGAVLILTGCGGFGMMICKSYMREEDMLRQLILALNYMECELRYRATPLPELCSMAERNCEGRVSTYFAALSRELKCRLLPDVAGCVRSAKETVGGFPERVDKILDQLTIFMGQFDIDGQIQSLDVSKNRCAKELALLEEHREIRLRSYQTLGLCGGAALIILLV